MSDWAEWAIARRRVCTVLAPDNGNIADQEAAPGPQDTDPRPAPGQAARPKSQVPVWREGLAWSVLSVDYQRILTTLADRHRLHQGPLTQAWVRRENHVGQDGDGLPGFAVVRKGAVGVPVGPQNVGQDPGVSCVGLDSGDTGAIAVTGGGQWVDRVDPAAGGAQAGDEQPTGVSMATGIGSSALSPCRASSSIRVWKPALSSLIRSLVP